MEQQAGTRKRETLPPGFVIAGRYEILKPLGVGGMGAVYLAQDTVLGNEKLAIKVLHADYIEDEDLMQRFLREVQLMRRVNHRNVVRTYDVGSDRNLVFFTMEYIHGTSLEKLLQKEAVQPKRIAAITMQICEALTAIHEAGILHRDLKPGNIILLDDGTVRITDFGVARPQVSHLTNHNEILGSVCYIAPEIWLGFQPTPAVDLYSLGIVMYEMATNRVPFDGGTAAELMRLHLDQLPVPPKEHNPSLPVWLNKLILNLLEKEPAKRFSSAKQVTDHIKLHAGSKNKNIELKQVVETNGDFLQKLEQEIPKSEKPTTRTTTSAPGKPDSGRSFRPRYTVHMKIKRSRRPAFVSALRLSVLLILYTSGAFALLLGAAAAYLQLPPPAAASSNPNVLALFYGPAAALFLLVLALPASALAFAAQKKKSLPRLLIINLLFFSFTEIILILSAADQGRLATTEGLSASASKAALASVQAVLLSPITAPLDKFGSGQAVEPVFFRAAAQQLLLFASYIFLLGFCLKFVLGGTGRPLLASAAAVSILAALLAFEGAVMFPGIAGVIPFPGVVAGLFNWLCFYFCAALFSGTKQGAR